MQSTSSASVTIIKEDRRIRIVCAGSWTIHKIAPAARELERFSPVSDVVWDVAEVSETDTAGIALWQLYNRSYTQRGLQTTLIGANEDQHRLYHLLYPRSDDIPPPPSMSMVPTVGAWFHRGIEELGGFLAYIGEAFSILRLMMGQPKRIRWHAIGSHILQTGAQALPIIAISAFLIGVVVAYQSIIQLQKFGADIFIVDTIGISLSRELAPLITAIVIAGRSGSAFTAQIGAMKITQEIDAMKTMGFDRFTFLVWPRIFALMIVMPLLIFFADVIGILGGMVVAQAHSGITFAEFLHRLENVLALKHYLIGIVKGPFFAFLIAIVSTYRGFQVSLNTESIGRYTTMSVVNSIFLVIACDALFSILLTELKL